MMTPSEQHTLDLLVRSRRGELDPDEQRALGHALDVSPVARSLYQAGLGFDAESPVRPGDEQLLARLVERIGAKVGRRPSRRWWRIALPPAAATLIATTAAAGAWFAFGRSAEVAPASGSGERSVGAAPSVRPRLAERVSSEPAEANLAPARPSARFAVPSPSPSELFARASRARREGRSAEAIALYERLDSVYPSSAEAQQAALTLGELYLQNGSAEAALRRFRSYSGRALVAEALWGEARALGRLGRVEEERRVLERLCREAPTSPYAEPARRRLGALGE